VIRTGERRGGGEIRKEKEKEKSKDRAFHLPKKRVSPTSLSTR
jgi:hypothetical protein